MSVWTAANACRTRFQITAFWPYNECAGDKQPERPKLGGTYGVPNSVTIAPWILTRAGYLVNTPNFARGPTPSLHPSNIQDA